MRWTLGVPLAWLNLTHNKRRLAASVAGIVSAVLLMFVEFGFLDALFDSQVAPIRMLNADLVMINKVKYSLALNRSFPLDRLQQALAIDGVAAVYPLYIESESSEWRNPVGGRSRIIRVLAFDPHLPIFRYSDIDEYREDLKQADTALFDAKSRPEYGHILPGAVAELARRRIRIVGLFGMGTDFVNDGNLLMSDRNFVRFFPRRLSSKGDLESVDIGLLRLVPGADLTAARQALRAMLPGDVTLLTPQELIAQEIAYWRDSAPLGPIFGIGAAMGFVIGLMICYQILFIDVTDHLPQFATLKAIGYTNRYLVGVVLQEALLLSCLGFLPGLALAEVLFGWLGTATGLPVRLTVGRASLVLGLTVAMATVSGLVALRRAVAVDPAEMFA